MEFEITRLSSKGQVVIPNSLRAGFKEGDRLLVIKSDGKLILRKATDIDEKLKEDVEFARRTEEALKRIEAGEYISIDSENIEEEMSKW